MNWLKVQSLNSWQNHEMAKFLSLLRKSVYGFLTNLHQIWPLTIFLKPFASKVSCNRIFWKKLLMKLSHATKRSEPYFYKRRASLFKASKMKVLNLFQSLIFLPFLKRKERQRQHNIFKKRQKNH